MVVAADPSVASAGLTGRRMSIQIFRSTPRYDFLRFRAAAFTFSSLMVLVTIVSFFAVGLTYGIDFRGGVLIEVATRGPADLGSMRATLGGLGLGEVELQEFGAPNDVLIRIARQPGEERAQQAAVDKVKAALGPEVEYRRTEVVGPKVGDELIRAGATAVVVSMFLILVYIWFRFEWQFGLAAIVALMHDVISTIGIYSLLGLEFNLTSVAALLTIAGYSINDTVVVFDRVRENLRKYKSMPLMELVNLSVNETLSRTILTSGTTLAAVLMLFLFGGEVIRGFSFAMIWGIVVGTYSSIWVASSLLLYFGVRRAMAAEREEKATGKAAP